MSDELIVIEHVHDTDAGVYRIVLGYKQLREETVYEDDGVTARRHPGEPVLDSEGEPMKIGEEPVISLGEVMTTATEELVPVEDFVFAADDERWEGKSPEDIAAAQRSIIRDAIDAREAAAAEEAAARAAAQNHMPGAGEAL